MEGLSSLASRYRQEFEQKYEVLRRRVSEFNDGMQYKYRDAQQKLKTIEPQVHQTRGDLLAALKDMEPLTDAKGSLVLETFAWTAVVEYGFRVSFVVGAYLLAPIIGLALNHNGAAFIAYVLLPYFAFLQLQQPLSDEAHRANLLSFAALEGLLVGFLLSRTYLSSIQPLSAITPLVIALSVHALGPKLANNRPALYGASLGGGVAVHLAVGAIVGQFSFSYFLLVLLHAAIGFAVKTHVYEYAYFNLTLFAQALVFFLLGGPAQE
ncbi:Protein W03D8.9 [Aphelenchoides avenae]|nr:Protein W03D8.9 [Aphelenchus avenae]